MLTSEEWEAKVHYQIGVRSYVRPRVMELAYLFVALNRGFQMVKQFQMSEDCRLIENQ